MEIFLGYENVNYLLDMLGAVNESRSLLHVGRSRTDFSLNSEDLVVWFVCAEIVVCLGGTSKHDNTRASSIQLDLSC